MPTEEIKLINDALTRNLLLLSRGEEVEKDSFKPWPQEKIVEVMNMTIQHLTRRECLYQQIQDSTSQEKDQRAIAALRDILKGPNDEITAERLSSIF